MTDRLGHDRRYAIDPSKIKAGLGWEPETSFEVGIERTIDWYLSNREWVEHATSGAYQSYYEQMYNGRANVQSSTETYGNVLDSKEAQR